MISREAGAGLPWPGEHARARGRGPHRGARGDRPGGAGHALPGQPRRVRLPALPGRPAGGAGRLVRGARGDLLAGRLRRRHRRGGGGRLDRPPDRRLRSGAALERGAMRRGPSPSSTCARSRPPTGAGAPGSCSPTASSPAMRAFLFVAAGAARLPVGKVLLWAASRRRPGTRCCSSWARSWPGTSPSSWAGSSATPRLAWMGMAVVAALPAARFAFAAWRRKRR